MIKVFITYANKYLNKALFIAEHLQNEGFIPFIDKNFLVPEGYWKPQIFDKVKESDVLLFLLSRESIESFYCIEEFNCAVDNSKRFILAKVDVDNINNTPEFFQDIEMINFINDDKKGDPLDRLVYTLKLDQPLFQLNASLHRIPIGVPPNAYQRAVNIAEALLNWLYQTNMKNPPERMKEAFARLFTITEIIRDDTELTVHIQHIALYLDKQNPNAALESCKKAIEKIEILKR